MTDNYHPITPPPELVQQIADGWGTWLEKIRKAYCVGADQQLKQCVDWVNEYESGWLNGYEREGPAAEQMRNACRPKPPSEAEVALESLSKIDGYAVDQMSAYVVYGELRQDVTTIRQALERLKELEKSNG